MILGRGRQSVSTQAHRTRSRVVGLPLDRHFAPGDPDDASNDTDGNSSLLEHRSLLDVQLEIRSGRKWPRRLVAEIADAIELVAESTSLAVQTRVDLGLREPTGDRTRRLHGRFEPDTLFVGPVD